jgi:perosamine synthetase
MNRINIYNPNIAAYTKSAMDAIKSGWISNHGKYIGLATEKLKEIMKCKHAILMANGTCATHCLFIALKHAHPTITKIYVPNNAYVAAWNAALMAYSEGQLSVMRMDARTWNICTDDDYIATLEPNTAMLVVHNVGNVVNVPRLKRLRPDLVFVEDNCEGFLGKYGDQYSGTSDATLCSSVSFYGNKIITTGEGGAFLTNDDVVYDHILKVYSQGMSAKRYVHEVHAYNYRMTNVQAAFLYDQLSDLDAIIAQKTRVFDTYVALLNECDLIRSGRVRLYETESGTQTTHWIFALRIVGNPKTVDETAAFFDAAGIDVRPFFYPIHAHAHLAGLTCDNGDKDNAISVRLNQEIIMVPSSPDIALDEQRRVIETVHKFVMQLNGIHARTIQDHDHHNAMTIPMLHQIVNIIKHDTDNLSFRYFNNRTIETALQTHAITNVYYVADCTNDANDAINDFIGYAHIDFDAPGNRHWFGIYICKSHRGKKYGALVLNDIIHQFCIQTKYQHDVYLSVDRTNMHALHLYEMTKFEIVETHDTYYVMRRKCNANAMQPGMV